MAGRIIYRSEVIQGAWQMPSDPLQPYRTRTYGFWIRDTIDRPLAPARSDAVSEVYRWYPLDQHRKEIRLLVLHAGRREEPISIHLQHASLLDPPPYEAISYVWGHVSLSTNLEVDGYGLQVPNNLLEALSNLRHDTQDRVLWADAVCIDQSNVEEKGHQVSIMRDVYATASRVVVWLGADSFYSGTGMDILEYWSVSETFHNVEAPWMTLPPSVVKIALKDLMNRAWWRRSWVVQEGAVAKEVLMVCGTRELRWTNNCIDSLIFLRAVKLAVVSPQWREAGLESVDMDNLLGLLQLQLDTGPLSHVWAHRNKSPDLLEYAYNMRRRETSDVRDRIFSLLGLLPESDTVARTAIVPDYTMSAEATYAIFSREMDRQTRELCRHLRDILNDAAEMAESEEEAVEHEECASRARSTASTSTAGQAYRLDSFVERACQQAIADIRNNEMMRAAQLLDEASTMLRGASFNSI